MLTEPLKTLTEPCLRHSNALRAWIMNSLVSYFCWWRDVGGRAGDFISILLCCICCVCVRSLCELGGRVGEFFFDCFAFNLLCLLCLCTIGWLTCVNSVGGWACFFRSLLLLICCICCVCDYPVSTRWAGGCFFYKLFALFCIKYLLSLCTIVAGVFLFAVCFICESCSAVSERNGSGWLGGWVGIFFVYFDLILCCWRSLLP